MTGTEELGIVPLSSTRDVRWLAPTSAQLKPHGANVATPMREGD